MGYDTKSILKPVLNAGRNIRLVIYKKHGLVVGDTPFFSRLIEEIDREARKNSYNLMISYVNETDEKKDEAISIPRESNTAGLIILATEMKLEDLRKFEEAGIPLIVLDSYFIRHKVDTVKINNCEGAYEAASYLIRMGHREIRYLHSSAWIHNFEERKYGYEDALKNNKLNADKNYIINLEPTIEGAYRDMKKQLEKGVGIPSAFFADNDIIAFGALKALKEKGYRIPEDVSIIGFDDMPYCMMADPPLTTIRVYNSSMACIAVRRLIEKIETNSEETVKIEVDTRLIVRNSVRKI